MEELDETTASFVGVYLYLRRGGWDGGSSSLTAIEYHKNNLIQFVVEVSM